MNIPKHLINLLGAVVVAGVVVAGLALVALPMWGAAQTIDASARSVVQSNDVYAIQVETLAAADARMGEITRGLAGLRTQIASRPNLDDVFEIAVEAAGSTGAVIVSVTAGEIEPWVPRAPVGSVDPAASPEGSTPESGESSPAPEGATTDASATGADAAAVGALPPQLQVPVTIDVAVVDAAAAFAFVDALGRGPRLLAPVDATFHDGTLTMTALAFIRTED